MGKRGELFTEIPKSIASDLPKLSVITVVRNSETIIEETILSVINQNYPNLEYIIIDGESTDNTLNIIKKYDKYIDYWISEPDKGIYDAMNKGILLASGDWVNFMNAGDQFNDVNTSYQICKYAKSEKCDILYGDVVAKDEINKLEIIVRAKPLNQIWKGMVFSHQSTFIKLQLLRDNPFDLYFKIAADFNQIIYFYINKASFYYVPKVISRTSINGLSYSKIQTTIEQIKVIHSISPYSFRVIHYLPKLLLDMLRIITGEKITNYLRGIKWKYFPTISATKKT